jgi:hypothetical protein
MTVNGALALQRSIALALEFVQRIYIRPRVGVLTTVVELAIIRSSARYPSGPRERSAKPPFVGSNPTRASKIQSAAQK